jgi:tetratricopeptide (TPR) repeat protein
VGKDYAKAQQESAAALKKFPNDRTIRAVHAQLLADQGQADVAIAELKKSLDGKNDRETYISIAEVYEKSHNYSEMSKALDAAEKLSQDKAAKATVLFMRGSMFEREKKYDQAEKMFRQVLETDPSNASALNYLGYMLADQNVRLQEAQDLVNRAVRIEPNNYAFLDSLGWVYYRLNRLDEAERHLTRSLQLMSKDPTIHDHLGDVYFKEGKLKEAISQWQSSLKEWNASSPADIEPDEVAKLQRKLDGARVRLAKEQAPNRNN